MSPATPKKQRLDELLVARGLAESRAQAKALIMAGRVRRGTERLDKPGKEFASDTELAVEQPPRFVSRGGEKLAAALAHFALDLRGAHILDVGASTGGFTDCALQAGAASAVCLDVGRAQLHAKLRNDSRVTNLEKVNARMDLSFISLCAVLPAVWPFVREETGWLIALVKPQFEAGKAEVDKGRGVIRDAAVQDAALAKVRDFALAELPAAELVGHIDSPIKGADGNREFLLVLKKRRVASVIHSDKEPDAVKRDAAVNAEEQRMPAANRSGILRELPTQYVGAGQSTILLTPDATQRRDALATQEPVVIKSNLSEDYEKAKTEAMTAFQALDRKVTNKASGREIEMVMSGFRKLRSHSGNLLTLKIIPALKELVENAMPLFENTGEGKHCHHYAAAAVIDGEPFFVRLVAFEGNNNKLQLDVFYDAQISPREIVEGLTSPSRSQETNEDARSRGPSKDKLARWWQLVKEQEALEAQESVLQELLGETNRVAEWANKQTAVRLAPARQNKTAFA